LENVKTPFGTQFFLNCWTEHGPLPDPFPVGRGHLSLHFTLSAPTAPQYSCAFGARPIPFPTSYLASTAIFVWRRS